MVSTRLMVRSLNFAALVLGICVPALSACGSTDGRPSSLVSGGGKSGFGGHSGLGGGGESNAGQPPDDTSGSAGESDDGAAGDVGMPDTPLAIFQKQLEVNVACAEATPEASAFLIRDGGSQALTITSASADSGYVVKGTLPLNIQPGESGTLLITPPAPKDGSMLGDTSTGTLTFATNEPGSPSHQVTLNTTLFGAKLEFADSDGMPLASGLSLTYLNSTQCPDTATYRVLNTGNLAIKLFGPTFPAHLGGTTAGVSGMSIAPGGYLELKVGGVSSPGDACSGSGELSFTVGDALCGTLPPLAVDWPTNEQPSCSCTAPGQ